MFEREREREGGREWMSETGESMSKLKFVSVTPGNEHA